jgi:hypothetical protein
MLYDLGFSETGKFRKFRDRWIPPEDQLEFCAFALTPGMPTAYVLYATGIRRWGVRYAFDLVDSWREIAEPLGIENAGSITVEDGYNMWKPRTIRDYNTSTPPHWVSVSIQTLIRTKQKTAKQIAAELRISERHVFSLMHSSYHPLTLQRLTTQRRKRHFQPY